MSNDSTLAAVQDGHSPAVSASVEALIRQHHGGSRMLVVDDQPLNLDVARILQEGTGLVVESAEARTGCFAAGMNDFIAKPCAPGRLISILLHWLSQCDLSKPDVSISRSKKGSAA